MCTIFFFHKHSQNQQTELYRKDLHKFELIAAQKTRLFASTLSLAAPLKSTDGGVVVPQVAISDDTVKPDHGITDNDGSKRKRNSEADILGGNKTTKVGVDMDQKQMSGKPKIDKTKTEVEEDILGGDSIDEFEDEILDEYVDELETE